MGEISRGKYSRLMRLLCWSRHLVPKRIDRSNRLHGTKPVMKNSTNGTPSDGSRRSPPNTKPPTRIGKSGRANSQKIPSDVPSYKSFTVRTARNHSSRRYRQSSIARAAVPSRAGSMTQVSVSPGRSMAAPSEARDTLHPFRLLVGPLEPPAELRRQIAGRPDVLFAARLSVRRVHDEGERLAHDHVLAASLAFARDGQAGHHAVGHLVEEAVGQPHQRLPHAAGSEQAHPQRIGRAEDQLPARPHVVRRAGAQVILEQFDPHAEMRNLVCRHPA